MTNAHMYWLKAGQSARMAQNASGTHMRNIYKAQEKAWRNIAVQLELLAVHMDAPPHKVSGIGWPLLWLRSVFKGRADPLT